MAAGVGIAAARSLNGPLAVEIAQSLAGRARSHRWQSERERCPQGSATPGLGPRSKPARDGSQSADARESLIRSRNQLETSPVYFLLGLFRPWPQHSDLKDFLDVE